MPTCCCNFSELQRDHTLVFPTNKKTVYSGWRSLMNKTGIKGLRFHDLRHEAISVFLNVVYRKRSADGVDL